MENAEIEKYYKSCGSIRQTAYAYKISCQKCRKILISAGAYTTPLASKINALHEQGMTVEQIAQKLNMRVKTVLTYMPYIKCVYNVDNPSKNAVAIRRHRKNKKENKR